MSSPFQSLEIERQPYTAIVWLNRPEVRNAFNEAMIAELRQAFEELGRDDSVRAVVLAGRGPAFCAGADLSWMKRMADFSEAENRADAAGLAAMLQAIDTCPKPVVARVHGPCYAGGMGLVAACDIAVASHEAEFCVSEVKLGLIPAVISPYLLRAIGARAARRWFLSAEKLRAGEAWRLGLVHELTEPDELDAQISVLLGALVSNSPAAQREAKRLIRDVESRTIDAALLDDTAGRIATIRASADGREGVRSFLEKRKPSWTPELPSASA